MDGDSTPGTADDITSYAWYEEADLFAESARVERDLALGRHALRLVVTDADSTSDEDTVDVEVVDTAAPVIRIEFPAPGECLGPSAVPVVSRGTAQDACTGAETPVTFEPPGPITVHGDHVLSASAADWVGNAGRVQSTFTLDLVAPRVTILEPEEKGRLLFPLELRFEATDSDAAAGGVVHEVALLDGCVVWDGATFGDGDGLLSDETLLLDQVALCSVAARCGTRAWRNPELDVVASDCGGNEGRAARRARGAYALTDTACGMAQRPPMLDNMTR
jgi:hypothetical protein